MTKFFFRLSLILLSVCFFSCQKDAGFGGLSTIQGKVYAKDITPNSQIVQDSGYTANIRVFIQVEGSGQVLDEMRTDINGEYKFDELRKGTYTLWTFTDCDSCRNNEWPVMQTITISARKETIVLSDFNIEI